MKVARSVVIVLAAVSFVCALVAHTASLLGPGSALPPRQATYLAWGATALLPVSIVIFLAGFFLRVPEPGQEALEAASAQGGSSGREIEGIILLITVFIKRPLWAKLTFICFVGYLILTQILVPTGSGDTAIRLRAFGAACGALNLLAIVYLSDALRSPRSVPAP